MSKGNKICETLFSFSSTIERSLLVSLDVPLLEVEEFERVVDEDDDKDE